MNYKGVEVILKTQSGNADPLEHPVDAVTMGVKVQIDGAFSTLGAYVSLPQLVSILASYLQVDVPYELEAGEFDLRYNLANKDATARVS